MSTNKDDQEDTSLKMLNARRMLEIRKKMAGSSQQQPIKGKDAAKVKPPSDRDIVVGALTDRGDEVLSAAEASYPRQVASIIPAIARLVREGKVSKIPGGELLQFFRSLGMRVSVNTSITVQEHGKFISLSDKLKNQSD